MTRYKIAVFVVAAVTISACGFRRVKYDNPISKDTRQPDKILYDRAINDLEHGRYEISRITLNTLINTYDQSEYLAKAKLAVADSWFREGGSAGLAQAEAEYKDFILFYPTMEEAAESQEKICTIHYRQMDKADRDSTQALRAEDECRQLIVQFPNSKFVPETQQMLRNIQEALGDGEFKVGQFYFTRGDNQATVARMTHLVDQYPLYSKADEALWDMGQAYGKLGNRFRPQEGDSYAKIVKDYPMSSFADSAKKKLKEMELPVPNADPNALARAKWEADNRQKQGLVTKGMGFLKNGPDTHNAARSGTPAMTTLRPPVPVLVPQPAAAGAGGNGGFVGEVTATPVNGSSALDTKPDARANPPAGANGAAPATGTGAAANTAGGTPAAGASGTAQASDHAAADSKGKKAKKPKKVKPQPASAPNTNPPATTQN
jgi:outer membrane protein assembly factor BamD